MIGVVMTIIEVVRVYTKFKSDLGARLYGLGILFLLFLTLGEAFHSLIWLKNIQKYSEKKTKVVGIILVFIKSIQNNPP
jgi:hypothetical protein